VGVFPFSEIINYNLGGQIFTFDITFLI